MSLSEEEKEEVLAIKAPREEGIFITKKQLAAAWDAVLLEGSEDKYLFVLNANDCAHFRCIAKALGFKESP